MKELKRQMTKTSKISYLFVAIIFFIIFDIYFSNIMMNCVETMPSNPVFDLIFIQNTGAAFSILENSKIFLISFSAFAILAMIIYLIKNIQKASSFAIFWASLLIAGVFCNMYERIAYGYVRDFFKLNFINFPVFNISDIFINISVVAIVIIIITNEINNRRTNG